VDIHLDIEGNNLVLTVADNGKGIKPEDISAKKSLGIFGMKERARSVNGKLTISGVSNIGTTVTLTIPIN
jgi:signal transduction histidine kinase